MRAHAALAYRRSGPVLLRATTSSGESPLTNDLDLFTEGVVARGTDWLSRIWQREQLRDAIQIASPVLASQIYQTLMGSPDERQVRRVVVSLTSYLLRWQGRATPFGLFAGVAAAQVGGEPRVRFGCNHKIVIRADASWLGGLVDRLERHPALLEQLPVIANQAAFIRGDRIVIAVAPPPGGLPEETAPLEISILATRAVQAAVHAASEPIAFSDLLAQMCSRYPDVSQEKIRAMLAELVTQHILLTALRAPATEPDAIAHLNAQLEASAAEKLGDLADLAREIRAIQADLACLNRSQALTVSLGAAVAHRMKAVGGNGDALLIVDVGLDCDVAIPEPVIREAEAAASTLLRLTPHPFGYPHWKEFHVRFKTRYGVGTVVPVADVIADSGLGLPARFLGSAHPPAPHVLTPRDDRLMALVQRAVLEGREEIVLAMPDIEALSVADPSETLAPPHAELAFEVHARSLEAVADGDFRLLVTGTPRPSSSMAGRFAGLLPGSERDRLARAFHAPPSDDVAEIVAQMSFPPRRRHSENVTRTPQLLPYVIPLSEYRAPSDDLIGLNDLGVTAGARQLYLVQLSTGRHVQARVLHALEAGVLTPPLARFLAEVATARCAVYAGFDWGVAARLPYLPRLRHGRTVLAPARWLLHAADLPAHDATMRDWEKALDDWRNRWHVPSAVVLCENELRLPLSLDHHLHRAVLRGRLDRARHVEMREGPPSGGLAWLGRAHEFLTPLRVTADAKINRQPKTKTPVRRAAASDPGHLPGISPWLHAQVHGHPGRQDEVLTDHLPGLFDGWDDPVLWWFSRHRELTRPQADQHLDLFVRLARPEDYGACAARIGCWAARLRDRGLLPDIELCTYRPESARFGDDDAMAAAEEVFAADSQAALAQIAVARRTAIPAQALTVAGMVDLALSYSDTHIGGLSWLVHQLPQEHGRLVASLRKVAVELADPRNDWAALHAVPGGENMAAAWDRRRTSLARYRTNLAVQRDPSSVLRSLLHLHQVRTLGVDPDQERVSNRLARAAALRQLALADADQP